MTRRIWLLLLIGLLAVFAAFGVLYAKCLYERRAFDRAVAELAARGTPVTFAELEVAVPDEENGAPLFDAAYAWWLKSRPEDFETRYVGPWNNEIEHPFWETSTPDQLVATAAYLDTLDEFWSQLRAAVERQHMVWHSPPDTDFGTPGMEHIGPIQTVIKLLHGRADSPGAPEDCLDALEIALRLGELAGNGNLIDVLVGTTIQHAALLQLQRAIQRDDIRAEDALAVLDRVPSVDWGTRVHGAVRYERVFAIHFERERQAGNPQFAGPPVGQRVYELVVDRESRPFISTADFIALLAALDRLPEFLPVHTADNQLRLAEFVEQESSENRAASAFLVIWPRVTAKCLETDAAAALARVALSVRAFRDVHGGWPETLDEVDRSFSLDLYSGSPFVYEVTDVHVIVRSSAPTEADDDRTLEERGLEWRFSAD